MEHKATVNCRGLSNQLFIESRWLQFVNVILQPHKRKNAKKEKEQVSVPRAPLHNKIRQRCSDDTEKKFRLSMFIKARLNKLLKPSGAIMKMKREKFKKAQREKESGPESTVYYVRSAKVLLVPIEKYRFYFKESSLKNRYYKVKEFLGDIKIRKTVIAVLKTEIDFSLLTKSCLLHVRSSHMFMMRAARFCSEKYKQLKGNVW